MFKLPVAQLQGNKKPDQRSGFLLEAISKVQFGMNS
jgi:hypothetical protein